MAPNTALTLPVAAVEPSSVAVPDVNAIVDVEAEPDPLLLHVGKGIHERRLANETRHFVEGETVVAWLEVKELAGKTVEVEWTREIEVIRRAQIRLGADGIGWDKLRMKRQGLYPAGGSNWGVEVIAGNDSLAIGEGFIVSGPCSRTHDCER